MSKPHVAVMAGLVPAISIPGLGARVRLWNGCAGTIEIAGTSPAMTQRKGCASPSLSKRDRRSRINRKLINVSLILSRFAND
jgi:hypothetical protein